MHFTRRASLALAAALALASPAAFAQPYPSKPIRLIVNFPPGGAADVIGRALAQQVGTQMQRPSTGSKAASRRARSRARTRGMSPRHTRLSTSFC